MNRIELYKNLKQAKLDEDRKSLIDAIDRLMQEAELFKRQLEQGHAFCADLTRRGQLVDQLAERIRNTTDTIGLLETIQNAEREDG